MIGIHSVWRHLFSVVAEAETTTVIPPSTTMWETSTYTETPDYDTTTETSDYDTTTETSDYDTTTETSDYDTTTEIQSTTPMNYREVPSIQGDKTGN